MSNEAHNSVGDSIIRSKILEIIEKTADKNPESTRCPSEVPRLLAKEGKLADGDNSGDGWRSYMDQTRAVVSVMRDEGILEVLQKGEVKEDALEDLHGPIRIRLKQT